MKTINKFLMTLSLAALFVALPAHAQTEIPTERPFAPDGVVLSKSAVEDGDNYRINLEAYVTGESIGKVESKPTDVIFVLDASSSLSDNTLKKLKEACTSMVNLLSTDAGDSKKHRISIVQFGLNRYGNTIPDDEYTNPSHANFLKETTDKGTSVRLSFTNDYAAAVSNINGLPKSHNATNTQRGLELAKLLIQYKSRNDANKIVILVTDGLIQRESQAQWGDKIDQSSRVQGDYRIAEEAMRHADNIKQMGCPVYVFDISSGSSNNREKFLIGVSSEYTGRTFNNIPKWPNANSSPSFVDGTQNPDGKDYYFAPSIDKLQNIIKEILEQTIEGGAGYQLDISTKVFDIVSTNFNLPDGTDVSKITLSVAQCTDVQPRTGSGTKTYTFAAPVSASSIFSGINSEVDGNSISVTGFDFSTNFVGLRAKAIGSTEQVPGGYKLIISFPIEVDVNCAGGFNIDTNTDASGIYKKETDGSYTQIAGFEMPKLDLPNIIIKKTGLHKGESAIFSVQRTKDAGGNAVTDASFNVTTTCSNESQPAVIILKLQKPGQWTVTESTWAWAHTLPSPNSITKTLDSSAQTDYTFEGKSIKGTLFQFSDPDKDDTPTHGEAISNNIFKTGETAGHTIMTE